MGQDNYESRDSQPETVSHFVKFVGGTTAVTKVLGPGVTVTYVSTGLVDIAWSENPGTFMGVTHAFQATTQTGVAGYTANVGAYNSTTRTIRVAIYNGASTPALADLAASQWLMLDFKFKQTAV